MGRMKVRFGIYGILDFKVEHSGRFWWDELNTGFQLGTPSTSTCVGPDPGEGTESRSQTVTLRIRTINKIEIIISLKLCEVDSLDVLDILRAVRCTGNVLGPFQGTNQQTQDCSSSREGTGESRSPGTSVQTPRSTLTSPSLGVDGRCSMSTQCNPRMQVSMPRSQARHLDMTLKLLSTSSRLSAL